MRLAKTYHRDRRFRKKPGLATLGNTWWVWLLRNVNVYKVVFLKTQYFLFPVVLDELKVVQDIAVHASACLLSWQKTACACIDHNVLSPHERNFVFQACRWAFYNFGCSYSCLRSTKIHIFFFSIVFSITIVLLYVERSCFLVPLNKGEGPHTLWSGRSFSASPACQTAALQLHLAAKWLWTSL